MSEPGFIFTANAVGAAGVNLNCGHHDKFPAKATCSLPTIGGVVRSKAGRFRIPGLVSFRRIESLADGGFNREERVWQTYVSSSATDFSLVKRTFCSGLLNISLHSIRRPGQDGSDAPISMDTKLDFTLMGHEVDVELDDQLVCVQTEHQIREQFSRQNPAKHKIKHAGDYYFYSPVKKIAWSCDGVSVDGIAFRDNVIYIEGLGEIHLAEVIRGCNSVRATLVQVHLTNGSAPPSEERGKQWPVSLNAAVARPNNEGSIAICEVESNGMDRPPNQGQ